MSPDTNENPDQTGANTDHPVNINNSETSSKKFTLKVPRDSKVGSEQGIDVNQYNYEGIDDEKLL